jgi:sugar-phosphatase
MDGTLIDSSANIVRAYRWWTGVHNLQIEPILAVERGRPHREVMAQFTTGLDLDRESQLFDDFESSDETGMPLIAGAEDAIRIAQQGRWAVVTSARRSLAEMRFRVTGLPLPRALITADIIRCGKPDPECYLLAAESLGTAPGDCIVFEDAPAGVEAAHRAGMFVVGVNTGAGVDGTGLAGTDLAVRNFLELDLRYEPDGWFTVGMR